MDTTDRQAATSVRSAEETAPPASGGRQAPDASTHSIRTESAPSRPDKPIIFFDGVCGLCNRFVDFALPRDRHQRLLFAPLQGETAARLLDGDDVESLKTVVLFERGRSFRRSAAVVRVLWKLGGFWRVLGGVCWLVPRPLRDLAYGFVARNRYRWFGKKESCRMPSPAERERILP